MKIFKQIQALFSQVDSETENTVQTVNLSMAALLCEVAAVDSVIDETEQQAKIKQLVYLLEIDSTQAKLLLTQAMDKSKHATSVYEFTSKLRDIDYDQRFVLIQAMWIVAYADGVIDKNEEALIRQVSDLIYITHSDFIRAKLQAKNRHI